MISKISMGVGVLVVSLQCWNSAFSAEPPKIAGFVSYGATKGDMDEGIEYDNGMASDELNLDTRDTRVGIQISAEIDANTSITTQFLGRGGANSDYHMNLDWGYINLKATNNLRVRLGKYKIAQFLVSDYADVGYAYPWVRPPQDVYGTNPLVSLDGVDLLYTKPLGSVKLLAQMFYGSGLHQTTVPARFVDECPNNSPDPSQCPPASMKGREAAFSTIHNRGYNIGISTDVATLRMGYFSAEVDVPDLGISREWGSFGGIGFTMDWHNFVTFAEFISRDTSDNLALAFPDQRAWYITQGYRIGKALPTFTYSHLTKGIDKSEFALEEHTLALGLRFEMSAVSAVKFEVLRAVPENGNHGLFSEPVPEARIYSFVFDTIF